MAFAQQCFAKPDRRGIRSKVRAEGCIPALIERPTQGRPNVVDVDSVFLPLQVPLGFLKQVAIIARLPTPQRVELGGLGELRPRIGSGSVK